MRWDTASPKCRKLLFTLTGSTCVQKNSKGECAHGDTGAWKELVLGHAASAPGECLSLPETLAAATPAQTAGVGAGLSWGLGWGLDVGRLPFSHLHSTHTAGLHHKHKEKEGEKKKRKLKVV